MLQTGKPHEPSRLPRHIYTETSNIDVDTLKNLGPLRPMAGIWEGVRGLDVVRGQAEPFHHTDRNVLARIGAPTPNPLARAADDATRKAALKTP